METLLVTMISVMILAFCYRFMADSSDPGQGLIEFISGGHTWVFLGCLAIAVLAGFGVLKCANQRAAALVLEIVSADPGVTREHVLRVAKEKMRSRSFWIPRIPGVIDECLAFMIVQGKLQLRAGGLFLPGLASQFSETSKMASDAAPTCRALNVFISYRHADSKSIAGRLSDSLKAKIADVQVFKDVDSNVAGLDFRDQLQSMVENAQIMIVLIGPHWLEPLGRDVDWTPCGKSDYVCTEIKAALALKLPIIPLLHERNSLPAPEEFPVDIRAMAFRHALILRDDPFFNSDVQKLIADIHAAVDRLPKLHSDDESVATT